MTRPRVDLLDRVRSLLTRSGVETYVPTAAERASPELLAARLRERNNRAGVHYWERATHLLRKKDFERCR